MDRIFTISRAGKLTEYESLEYALEQNEFVCIKFLPTLGARRFQFWDGESFSNILNFRKWKLRLNDVSKELRCIYNIIDKHGIIKHFHTNNSNFDGLSEMIMKFAHIVEYKDYNDEDYQKRELEHDKEKLDLLKQIQELKTELEKIKNGEEVKWVI